MHIWDICQNSINAGADKIVITLDIKRNYDRLMIKVKDNGIGIDKEALPKVKDPFYTTKEKAGTGLGIPLFKMAAELTGGKFSIASKPNVGTVVRAVFVYSHVDRAPLGDIAYAVGHIICLNASIEIEFIFRTYEEFFISTSGIKAVLENLTLNRPKVTELICEFIRLKMQEIYEDLY